MPVRDDQKRMEFLRSLSTQDLANRRITEYSSETEKKMIHEAREMMKAENDERYLRRHEQRAKLDIKKAAANDVRRRFTNEVVGKEGGLTGGLVGQYVVPVLTGTAAVGLGATALRRGNLGAAGKALNPFAGKKQLTPKDKAWLKSVMSDGTVTKKDRRKARELLEQYKAGWLDIGKKKRKHLKDIKGKKKKSLLDTDSTPSTKSANLPSNPPSGGGSPPVEKPIKPHSIPTQNTSVNTSIDRSVNEKSVGKMLDEVRSGNPKTAAKTTGVATLTNNQKDNYLSALERVQGGKAISKIATGDKAYNKAVDEMAQAIKSLPKDEQKQAATFLTQEMARMQKLTKGSATTEWQAKYFKDVRKAIRASKKK